jgi:glutaredoxin
MLTLYGTSYCHLCHDAQALLRQLHLTWQDVDIVEDEHLFQLYQTSIPVLACNEHQLFWPFTLPQLIDFINEIAPESLAHHRQP